MKADLSGELAQELISVAAGTVVSDAEFRERARRAAEKLGPACLDTLPKFFHDPPPKPNELAEHFNGLGHWMSVCQFASFEIMYNLREAAIPTLRRFAFGIYDWTQGNAIEILCRLATEGIERERTIDSLKREMPDMRFEALLYAAEPLMKRAVSDPRIGTLLEELRSVEEFREAIEELREGPAYPDIIHVPSTE